MSNRPASVTLDGDDVEDIATLLEATEAWLRFGHLDGRRFSSFFPFRPPAEDIGRWMGEWAAHLRRCLARTSQ